MQTSVISLLNGKQILEHVVEHVMFGHCSSTLNLTLTFRSPFVRHLEVSDGVSEVKSGCYVRITIILTWYKKICEPKTVFLQNFILEKYSKMKLWAFLALSTTEAGF